MVVDRRGSILPLLAGLVGLVVGWIATHGVLWTAGYTGDPSRGAAFTGAAVCGIAAGAMTQWLIGRRPRPR